MTATTNSSLSTFNFSRSKKRADAINMAGANPFAYCYGSQDSSPFDNSSDEARMMTKDRFRSQVSAKLKDKASQKNGPKAPARERISKSCDNILGFQVYKPVLVRVTQSMDNVLPFRRYGEPFKPPEGMSHVRGGRKMRQEKAKLSSQSYPSTYREDREIKLQEHYPIITQSPSSEHFSTIAQPSTTEYYSTIAQSPSPEQYSTTAQSPISEHWSTIAQSPNFRHYSPVTQSLSSEYSFSSDINSPAASSFTQYDLFYSWNPRHETSMIVPEVHETIIIIPETPKQPEAILYAVPLEHGHTVKDFLREYMGTTHNLAPSAILVIDVNTPDIKGSVITTLSMTDRVEYGPRGQKPRFRFSDFREEGLLYTGESVLVPELHDPQAFIGCLLDKGLITLSAIQPVNTKDDKHDDPGAGCKSHFLEQLARINAHVDHIASNRNPGFFMPPIQPKQAEKLVEQKPPEEEAVEQKPAKHKLFPYKQWALCPQRRRAVEERRKREERREREEEDRRKRVEKEERRRIEEEDNDKRGITLSRSIIHETRLFALQNLKAPTMAKFPSRRNELVWCGWNILKNQMET
jgi:hypothetical protein